MREERIFENSARVWGSPKVLILFPGKVTVVPRHVWRNQFIEGEYPYMNKHGKVWGSVEDLIKKEKERETESSLIISREFIDYEYTPSAGTGRRLKLELLKLRDKKDGKNYYTVVAENRSLSALAKMANRGSGGHYGVSKADYKIHFKV